MKLSKWRDTYDYYSSQASNNTRQLAFAGIAVIWLFKIGDDSKPLIPPELVLPLGLLVLTLAFDLLHYVAGTVVWGIVGRLKECRYSGEEEDPDFPASRFINHPTILFFSLKLVAVFLAYYFLLKFFWSAWFVT
jgi:hypothetical protein